MISKLILLSFLATSMAASCSHWCGYTSTFVPGVGGPPTSVPRTAYYFFNNTYPPNVFLTPDNVKCPVQFSINGSYLLISGIVSSISNSSSGFIFAYQFQSTNEYNPLLELQSNQYRSNGGTVDPTLWSFFHLIEGTLAGYGSYQNVSLAVSELTHPLQIGTGASGKNLNYGAGGWFSYVDSQGVQHQTDLNVDLTCDCDPATTCSSHGACDTNQSCYCYTGYAGNDCSQCASGYSGYPNCVVTCDADTTCSSHGTCVTDGSCTTAGGSCLCYIGFTGLNCNQCSIGYYNYPLCVACDAATNCTSHGTCAGDGTCVCSTGYSGDSCTSCSSGYSGYPYCTNTTSITGGQITNPTTSSSVPTTTASTVNAGNSVVAISWSLFAVVICLFINL